jgi:hypothetical protein
VAKIPIHCVDAARRAAEANVSKLRWFEWVARAKQSKRANLAFRFAAGSLRCRDDLKDAKALLHASS